MGGHQIHWFPLILAGFLALTTVWLNQLTHRPVLEDNGGFAHEPDTIVRNFNALAFDSQGRAIYRLTARQLVHYLDDATTELDRPHFSVLDKNRVRSEMRADRGQISTNGEHVHLLGNVHMIRHAPPPGIPLTLDTEYLWITPDANLARTDRPVTLVRGKSRVTAGSMLAHTNRKDLTLAGGVHGIYE